MTGALAAWSVFAMALFIAVVLTYAVSVVTCSTSVALKHGIRCGIMIALIFPVLHVANGLGSLKGVLDFLILRRTIDGARAVMIPLSR